MLTFLKHFPYDPAPAPETAHFLEGFGTTGETVTFSFSLKSDETLHDLQISATDLTGPGLSIGAQHVEIFIVKVWEQAGIGLYQSQATSVAELLVKEDMLVLEDSYMENGYQPPSVRLTGPPRTTLPPDTSKQIFLTVKIPPTTPPGDYTGTIHCDFRAGPLATLPIRLQVLPFQLIEPRQDFLLWYKGTLGTAKPQHAVSRECFQHQLQDIYDHGFRSLTFHDTETERVQEAIDIAEAIGFDGHAVFCHPFPQEPHRLHYQKLTPVFYLSDELDLHPHMAEHHHQNAQHAHHAAVKTMCSLVHQGTLKPLLKTTPPHLVPHLVSFSLAKSMAYFRFHAQFEELRAGSTYYYWPCHMEKPTLNRALAGVYLWKSKADGISPYCYQHLPKPPFSPLNDFDDWEPRFKIGEETRPFKDHMTTYRAQEGSILTLQWEGLREGITDLKYCATLDRITTMILTHWNQSPPAQIANTLAALQKPIDAFLQRIHLGEVNLLSETDPTPYADISPEDYQNFRRHVANSIIALQAFLPSESRSFTGVLPP